MGYTLESKPVCAQSQLCVRETHGVMGLFMNQGTNRMKAWMGCSKERGRYRELCS